MPITLENVEFTYMAKTPYERKALQGVSLTVDKGEFVAVIGHTGSGKSTLVQHLNGLLKPSAGKVTIDGLDISDSCKIQMLAPDERSDLLQELEGRCRITSRGTGFNECSAFPVLAYGFIIRNRACR